MFEILKIMFRKIQLFFLVCLCASLFLSSTETKAQSGKLPPFRIMQTNGTVFKAEQLPFEKPIIVAYFDPECHDCQTFMGKLFSKTSNFKSASIAFITNVSTDAVAKFAIKYKISNYKNMVVGTEGVSSFIGNYYHYPQLPFVALYDKNGNLITTYQKNIPIDELITKLTQLK